MNSKSAAEAELIAALQYANEHPAGFTQNELAKYLGKEMSFWGIVLKQQFGVANAPSEKERLFHQNGENEKHDALFVLSVEGTKLLFEIVEIEDLKSQSLQTRTFAILSIAISVAAIFLPLLANSCSSTTIKIDHTQFQKMQDDLKRK